MYQNYLKPNGNDDNFFMAFGTVSNTTPTTFTAFQIPSTAKMIMIYLQGGGAGGGGGGASLAGTIAAGAQGGGSGTFCTIMLPAFLLPSTLYYQCGNGGTGGTGQVQAGAAATAGNNASSSCICIAPDKTISANILFITGTAPAVGGAAANGATPGTTAGAKETIDGNTINGSGLAGLGILANKFGSSGGQGSAVAPTDIVFMGSDGITSMASGGTGGGTVSAAGSFTRGAALTCGGLLPNIQSPNIAGARGNDGYNFIQGPILGGVYPMLGSGGTGGSAATGLTIGGFGGNGAPGSGGGGGGGCQGIASVAGDGGNGGPGYIIIRCW